MYLSTVYTVLHAKRPEIMAASGSSQPAADVMLLRTVAPTEALVRRERYHATCNTSFASPHSGAGIGFRARMVSLSASGSHRLLPVRAALRPKL